MLSAKHNVCKSICVEVTECDGFNRRRRRKGRVLLKVSGPVSKQDTRISRRIGENNVGVRVVVEMVRLAENRRTLRQFGRDSGRKRQCMKLAGRDQQSAAFQTLNSCSSRSRR